MLYVLVLIQMGTGYCILDPPHYCLWYYFPAFGLGEDAFMGELRLWSVCYDQFGLCLGRAWWRLGREKAWIAKQQLNLYKVSFRPAVVTEIIVVCDNTVGVCFRVNPFWDSFSPLLHVNDSWKTFHILIYKSRSAYVSSEFTSEFASNW